MKLQEKLDRLKENAINRMPKEAVESIHRAVEDLKASGILDGTVKVGQKAPDFEAPAYQDGKFGQVKLSDYLGKWVILCFYPGDFTFV